jgi:hypothetical protein
MIQFPISDFDVRLPDDYNSTGCRTSERETISPLQPVMGDFNAAAGEKG